MSDKDRDTFLRFMQESAGFLKVTEVRVKKHENTGGPLDYIFIKDVLNKPTP